MDKDSEKCIPDELLIKYIDDLLDDDTKTKIETHLKKCTSCFNILNDVIHNLNQNNRVNNKTLPIEIVKKIDNLLKPKKKNVFKIVLSSIKNQLKIIDHTFININKEPAFIFRGKQNPDCIKFEADSFYVEVGKLKHKYNVNINFNKSPNSVLKLINDNGKILYSFIINEENVEINDLSKGNYIITFNDNEITLNIE